MVIVLIVWSLLLVVLPLGYILAISFMEKGELSGVAQIFTLDNYRKIFGSVYHGIYMRTIITALVTTALTFFLGFPLAYHMARLKPSSRMKSILLLVAPFWTNSLIRMYGWIILLRADGWINKLLLAIGVIQDPVKLLYTPAAVLIGMVYALLPMMTLSIYNSTEKIDWILVEAARDLGASKARALFSIILPQTRPGIIGGAMLTFVPSMGIFFVSDILGGAKQMILGNLIQNEVQSARNWPFAAALSVLMLIAMSFGIWAYRRFSGSEGWEGVL